MEGAKRYNLLAPLPRNIIRKNQTSFLRSRRRQTFRNKFKLVKNRKSKEQVEKIEIILS